MGAGWFWCSACRRNFTVRVRTVLERSHIPLHKWLIGFRLYASSKKGFSAHQLHRTIGVTYKTGWFMAHRIREAMADDTPVRLGGEGKVLEADETYVNKERGRGKWIFSNELGWVKVRERRSLGVFALVERAGKAVAVPLGGRSSHELRTLLKKHGDTKSKLMTDDWQAYERPAREFAGHETVIHSKEEWVRGEVHTNTVENFFSVFKRGMRGVYQHCSDQHMARYLHEFAFCYSNRSALGVDDVERSTRAIRGAEGKRLTYR
jgi:IS1 family transposase